MRKCVADIKVKMKAKVDEFKRYKLNKMFTVWWLERSENISWEIEISMNQPGYPYQKHSQN